MTMALITIDTELSPLLHQRGVSAENNLASSVFGRCVGGDFGIGWQMDRMEEAGLKAVFFVDPLPALVYGDAIIAEIVRPILDRGHEVQLHIHTEWLEWTETSPVADRKGQNIRDFSLDDQVTLLSLASDILVRVGAPRPIAFRAGNFGANEDTLRAAARIGLIYDSSFNAAFAGGACQIDLAVDQIEPLERHGIIELPVSGLFDRPGNFRAAQVCALSSVEMGAALLHAAHQSQCCFVAVTHSFEMLSRDRQRPNWSVIRRFEAMCRSMGCTENMAGATFADLHKHGHGEPVAVPPKLLPPDRWRTAARMAEQAVGLWLYERRLNPATLACLSPSLLVSTAQLSCSESVGTISMMVQCAA